MYSNHVFRKIYMTIKNHIVALLCCFSLSLSANQPAHFSSPTYADPFYTGSCDPEIVFNPSTKEYLIFYTGRRPSLGVAAACGTPIGVAASKNMIDWEFRGFCKFDGKGGTKDSEQTYWAPGIIIVKDTAHMFVTYKEDATPPWGTGGVIAHYKTPINDIINGWKRVDVTIGEVKCLDACVIKLPNGKFRMYYVGGINNAEQKGKRTIRYAESENLYTWKVIGNVGGDVNNKEITGFGYQEGVFVFQLASTFYMTTDPHKGLCTYSSADGITWKYHGQIMTTNSSKRNLDWSQARHASVIFVNKKAYIAYHVEPFRPEDANGAELEKHQRYAFIQLAGLKFNKDGSFNSIEHIK